MERNWKQPLKNKIPPTYIQVPDKYAHQLTWALRA